MVERRSQEMIEKPFRDTFFSLKGASQRPVSVATEFMESDWEMDEEASEVHSEFEEDGEPSPRGSYHSANSVRTLLCRIWLRTMCIDTYRTRSLANPVSQPCPRTRRCILRGQVNRDLFSQ
jgi:hypothetical protein